GNCGAGSASCARQVRLRVAFLAGRAEFRRVKLRTGTVPAADDAPRPRDAGRTALQGGREAERRRRAAARGTEERIRTRMRQSAVVTPEGSSASEGRPKRGGNEERPVGPSPFGNCRFAENT